MLPKCYLFFTSLQSFLWLENLYKKAKDFLPAQSAFVCFVARTCAYFHFVYSPIVYVAPSTVNVAALHLLKKRDAKSNAEFFKLDDTRRMGESGQDVGGCRSGSRFWCIWSECTAGATPLVTVLAAVNRAVSTAGTTVPGPADPAPGPPGTGHLTVTGVAAPGARRRGAFDRFELDIFRTCLLLSPLALFDFSLVFYFNNRQSLVSTHFQFKHRLKVIFIN